MIKKTIKFAFLISSILFTTQTIAAEVKTDGGFEIFRSDDSNYWFKMHGVAKVDAIIFGDDFDARQNEFPSGTNVRALESTFNGGIGQDLSYTITLSFESGVGVNDTYFTYTGFKNTEINIGQVISHFCLENANSGKWIPFLERSLPVTALRPCMGIGASVVNWGDNYALLLASTTVPHGQNRDTSTIKHRSDRLTNTGRFVFLPYRDENYTHLVQMGISGVYAENNPTFRDDSLNTDGRRFSTRPEARARNTRALVDSGNSMFIKHYNEQAAEIAGLWGPLLMQAEYIQVNIHRKDRPNLHFYGWHAQAAYVLTGETRAYKIKSGSFGQVKPKCKYGAWEVAARYSMIDLNDQDIHGGKENNFSLALLWYVNQNLLIMGNYIYASIDPTQALGAANNPHPNKRHLNIYGTRAQIVW